MYLIFVIMISCKNINIFLKQKVVEESFEIDWDFNPIEYSHKPNFAEVVCEDISKRGLFHGSLCKFYVLLEEEHAAKLKDIWKSQEFRNIILNSTYILPEVVKKLISITHSNNEQFWSELINDMQECLNENGELDKNLSMFFKEALNFNNFSFASKFLKLIRDRKLQIPSIDLNMFSKRLEDRGSKIKRFIFLIDKKAINDEDLSVATELVTSLKDIDLTLEMMKLIKKRDHIFKILHNVMLLSKDDKEYDRRVIEEVYLNFGEYDKSELVEVMTNFELIKYVPNSILGNFIYCVYSYGHSIRDISKVIAVYNRMDDLFSFKIYREEILKFIRTIKGDYSGYGRNLRKFLRENFKNLIWERKDSISEAYDYLDKPLFLEILEILYDSDETQDKKNFLEKVNLNMSIKGKRTDKRHSEYIKTLSNGSPSLSGRVIKTLQLNSKSIETKERVFEINNTFVKESYLDNESFLGEDYSEDSFSKMEKKYGDIIEMLVKKGLKITEARENGSSLLKIALWNGYPDIAMLLIERGAEIEFLDRWGDTPLIKASERGYVDVVEALLNKGANVNFQSEHGRTALMNASQNSKEIVELLINAGADVDRETYHGYTALIFSLMSENKNVVELIMKKAKNLDSSNEDGLTALSIASGKGYLEVVEALLNKGAEINLVPSPIGMTALMSAAKCGEKEVVKLLLKRGADIDIKSIYGETALMFASCNGNVETARILINAGSEINALDYRKRSALMLASLNGHKDVVEVLLLSKCKINIKDNEGNTALMLAAEQGESEIVELLIDYRADKNAQDKNGNTALIKAAIIDRKEILEILLERGADVNIANQDGLTLALLATLNDDKYILEILKGKKISYNVSILLKNAILMHKEKIALEYLSLSSTNVNLRYKNEKTLLMISIEEGMKNITKYILDFKNPELGLKDKEGKEELFYAISKRYDRDQYAIDTIIKRKKELGFKSIVEMLFSAVELGSSESLFKIVEGEEGLKQTYLNSVDDSGKSLLERAVLKNDLDIVRFLVEEKVNVNYVDKDGYTAFILSKALNFKNIENILLRKTYEVEEDMLFLAACEYGNIKIVEDLIKKTKRTLSYGDISNIDLFKSIISKNPLEKAILKDHLNILKLLIKEGINLEEEGYLALIYASKIGEKEVVELLIEKRLEINTRDSEGKTAMMYASESGNKEVVEVFLKKGVEVNLLDKQGKTALIYASLKHSNKEVVKILIEAGAEVDAVDKSGKTAMMYASERGDEELLNLLGKKYRQFK